MAYYQMCRGWAVRSPKELGFDSKLFYEEDNNKALNYIIENYLEKE